MVSVMVSGVDSMAEIEVRDEREQNRGYGVYKDGREVARSFIAHDAGLFAFKYGDTPIPAPGTPVIHRDDRHWVAPEMRERPAVVRALGKEPGIPHYVVRHNWTKGKDERIYCYVRIEFTEPEIVCGQEWRPGRSLVTYASKITPVGGLSPAVGHAE